MESLADIVVISQLDLLDVTGTPRNASTAQLNAAGRSSVSQIYRAPGPPLPRSSSVQQALKLESGLVGSKPTVEEDDEEFDVADEADNANLVTQKREHGSSATVGEKPEMDEVHILKSGSLLPEVKPSFFRANLGLLWMLLAACLFTVMSISVKSMTVASERLPTLEIVFFRSILCWVMGIACMLYWDVPDVVFGPKGVRHLLAMRSVIGFMGLVCGWTALSMLTLADSTVLGFLSPVFTAILARVILKEPYQVLDAITGTLSMIGVLIIARPPFLFGSTTLATDSTPDDLLASGVGSGFGAEGISSETPFTDPSATADATSSAATTDSSSNQLLGCLIALVGATFGALVYIVVRKLCGRALPLHIVSVFSLVSIPLSVLVALIAPGDSGAAWFVPKDPLTYMYLLLVSSSALGGQLCVTKSLEIESAGKASSMNYVQVIFAFMAEWIIWGTPPSISSMIGGSIVGSSILIITLHKLRSVKK
ncbi:hypothetical protein BDZ88DRAFT_146527 [Geranomyces variabilis]|nr:hypothetical protein BDZ88DRAFT_146527 [Geranomyces variabilis]KAJ3140631.1 hypothetical protein HDU90_007933 [Geranomyces variabilis]